MRSPDDTPVLILTGPPGAGRTTAARVLAERSERAVHVESDRFFEFIRSGLVDPWKPEYAVLRAPLDVCVARAGSRGSRRPACSTRGSGRDRCGPDSPLRPGTIVPAR